MILLVVFFITISSNIVQSKNAACEQLIECYAKSRAKTYECLSHIEKRDCGNESLESELKELTDERDSLYDNCLREKSPTATDIVNAKKKAKCNVVLRKNIDKIIAIEKNNKKKNRRSISKGKKSNIQQKTCFREARKLRSHCGQLSKCCTISKLCKIHTTIDEKITAKKLEIKKADEQCRMERLDRVKAKNKDHKRGGYHRGGQESRKSKNTNSDI